MDKIDRLLNAIEHPAQYSDKEIKEMLADAEAREAYEAICKTQSSLQPIAAPNVDSEWETFALSRKKRFFGLSMVFSRNVAASIAIGISSLVAAAALVGAGVYYLREYKTETIANEISVGIEERSATPDSMNVADKPLSRASEIIYFDNEELQTIVMRIADYYGYEADFATGAPKHLRLYYRWNQTHTIEDIVESLNNFEQIVISIDGKTIKIG